MAIQQRIFFVPDQQLIGLVSHQVLSNPEFLAEGTAVKVNMMMMIILMMMVVVEIMAMT